MVSLCPSPPKKRMLLQRLREDKFLSLGSMEKIKVCGLKNISKDSGSSVLEERREKPKKY